MDGQILTIIAAAVLSLALEYLPGVRVWFDGLTPAQKRQVNGLGVVAIAAAVFGLGCWPALSLPGWFPAVPCTQGGAWEMIAAVAVALGVNQGVHSLTKRPEADTVSAE